MTKALLIFIAVLGLVGMKAQAENPIDLSTSDNLKAVYDAGFRPWRSTLHSCTVTDKNISVILSENAQFSLSTQIATFSVLPGDQLSSADFISEVMSTDEAVAKIHEICSALGLPFDGLAQAVPTFNDRASKPTIWNTRGQRGAISVDVTLDRLDFIDHLGAKVYVTLQWKRGGIPPKFSTSPMQPPAGYETESMVPPGVNPNQKGFPAHDMQYYKDLIAKKKAQDSTAPIPTTPPPSPSPSAPQVQPASETGIPGWVYGLIVLSIVVVIGAGYYLWSRKRNGP